MRWKRSKHTIPSFQFATVCERRLWPLSFGTACASKKMRTLVDSTRNYLVLSQVRLSTLMGWIEAGEHVYPFACLCRSFREPHMPTLTIPLGLTRHLCLVCVEAELRPNSAQFGKESEAGRMNTFPYQRTKVSLAFVAVARNGAGLVGQPRGEISAVRGPIIRDGVIRPRRISLA